MKLFILAMGLLIFNILDGTFIMFSIWETTDKSVFYALHSLVFLWSFSKNSPYYMAWIHLWQ